MSTVVSLSMTHTTVLSQRLRLRHGRPRQMKNVPTQVGCSGACVTDLAVPSQCCRVSFCPPSWVNATPLRAGCPLSLGARARRRAQNEFVSKNLARERVMAPKNRRRARCVLVQRSYAYCGGLANSTGQNARTRVPRQEQNLLRHAASSWACPLRRDVTHVGSCWL